jgi:two-component system phosphate regulon sensor histidine kinase PhoR
MLTGSGDQRVRSSGRHLVGLVPGADGRVVVARLDPAGVRGRLEARTGTAELEELGVDVRIVPESDPEDPNVLASRPLLAKLGLPLRAEVERVRAPGSGALGPSALFYWGIIAGAAGGLALGGYVLVRTFRREMRLARLKADFVGNLSHELKTPLTSIAMFTEMLREGRLSTAEDREEAYDVLTQEASRLQRIVGRMIDTVRRETRAEPYALRPADLNRPVREAASRLRRIVTEPGLDLVLDLAPGPLPVLLDEAAMDDTVTNLLSNSWKYRQGDRARITVRTRRRRRSAELVVADDGVGIPRHERRKVFEMFYRADQYLTRAVPGTGLGLALVRTIVRAHRGSVRIEGGDGGRGTLFRLRFPLTRAPLAPGAPPSRAPEPAPSRDAPTGPGRHDVANATRGSTP